jgi:hypothetical protein
MCCFALQSGFWLNADQTIIFLLNVVLISGAFLSVVLLIVVLLDILSAVLLTVV